MADLQALIADLDASRDAFLVALGDVDAELATVPGVVGDWSVRDLVVHVAAWCEHGAHALELAAAGRGAEFSYATDQTDAMNERILAESRAIAPRDALAREETAFAQLRRRVAGLDEALLTDRLGNGDTIEAVIRYDGADHYREHTEHLRSWFAADEDVDE